MNRYFRFVPAVAVMLFIFFHSAMPAGLSSEESGWIVDLVMNLLPFDISSDHLTFLIRKAAHFTEYLLLGLSLEWSMDFRKRTFLFGTGYAVLDEIHQFFVPGRSCEIRDMCIDAAGVLIGMFLMKTASRKIPLAKGGNMRKKKERIQLSEHFTYTKLLRFCFPTMVMMVFTSLYDIVDGLFVSNFVGKNAFAALNLIFPALMILGGVGTMFGTGGTALVAKTLGEDRRDDANRYFSMMVEMSLISSLIFSVVGFLWMKDVALLLGADDTILDDCVLYGRVCILFLPAFQMQYLFQSFLTAAEKPRLGLRVMIAAGVTNMILDALFVGILRWGIFGAAAATDLSQVVGGILPLLYFCRENDSLLHFVPSKLELAPVRKACFNGVSELMTMISMSVVSIIYNLQLMKYAGADGVAVYGVLMYVQFVFGGVLYGYTFGSAPIAGFHFGAGHHGELNNLLRKGFILEYVGGGLMFLLAQIFARPISELFVGYDAELTQMTVLAFRIFLFNYLLAGGNMFASSFFTSLNDGRISAVISFMRSMVFELAAVLLLPLIFGIEGIWGAVSVAEIASCCFSWFFIFRMDRKYRYLRGSYNPETEA